MRKSISDVLLVAANVVEHGDISHPLDAIAIAAGSLREYHAAARQFHDICGPDNMDLSRDEMVDNLIAVAMMEWP